VPYDALKDFDYITVAVQAPNVLVVPAASPHKSLADVLAFHKANPGKMSFASSGNGSSDHLTAELFWQQTGTSGLHIPYKGGGPAMSDLLGGQVDATFQNINAVHAAHQGRQAARAGHHQRQALAAAARRAHAGRAGRQGRHVYSWQAWPRPRACRPTSRPSCTPLLAA
jgi:tripartite-type tricarboxylate transporter receptor subunit TctC